MYYIYIVQVLYIKLKQFIHFVLQNNLNIFSILTNFINILTSNSYKKYYSDSVIINYPHSLKSKVKITCIYLQVTRYFYVE